MAFKTLTIKEIAYEALARCKQPDKSFSDVIERKIAQKITTTDELLAHVRSLMGKGLGLRQKSRRKAIRTFSPRNNHR